MTRGHSIVADWWAGASNAHPNLTPIHKKHLKCLFSHFSTRVHWPTDQRMYRLMDWRTDRQSLLWSRVSATKKPSRALLQTSFDICSSRICGSGHVVYHIQIMRFLFAAICTFQRAKNVCRSTNYFSCSDIYNETFFISFFLFIYFRWLTQIRSFLRAVDRHQRKRPLSDNAHCHGKYISTFVLKCLVYKSSGAFDSMRSDPSIRWLST